MIFKKPEIIVIHNKEQPRSEKEALLILPGFGDRIRRRKTQLTYFKEVEYDLFIPNYIAKKSLSETVEKLAQFYEDKQLIGYKKVHVFAYILGSWTINTYINKYGRKNINTIIYDRSPLQERAPRLIMDIAPLLGKWIGGKVLEDLSLTKYPPIPKEIGLKLGIIVESKATSLIRMFRKTAMSYGEIDWNKLNFHQASDDLMFTRLNHDEMYFTFDEIGEDILHFIKKGVFTPEAKRTPFNWDVFKRYGVNQA